MSNGTKHIFTCMRWSLRKFTVWFFLWVVQKNNFDFSEISPRDVANILAPLVEVRSRPIAHFIYRDTIKAGLPGALGSAMNRWNRLMPSVSVALSPAAPINPRILDRNRAVLCSSSGCTSQPNRSAVGAATWVEPHSCQHFHFNTFASTQSLQHIHHFNTFTSKHTFTSNNSLQHIHFNTFTSTQSLQQSHSLQHIHHFNT